MIYTEPNHLAVLEEAEYAYLSCTTYRSMQQALKKVRDNGIELQVKLNAEYNDLVDELERLSHLSVKLGYQRKTASLESKIQGLNRLYKL